MKSIEELLEHKDISFSSIDDSICVTNPANDEPIAYVKKISDEELNVVINKSQIAQKKWAKTTALEKSDTLLRWSALIAQNRDNLAKIMTLEQGKSINEAKGEIDYANSFIRWFAEEARRIDGDILTSTAVNQKLLVIKQPIGVTAAITPWNFPSSMITRKAAPALAAGCSMVVKPASATPLSAYALAVLAQEAGFDEDLFVVISGRASAISDIFCKSEIVKKISFTGSTEIGKKLYANCSHTVKKISLELGGNAPVVVFDDANIDKAVDGIMQSKFRNSGQTCVCANRVYVQSGIYDKLATKLSAEVEKLKVGNGLDEDTTQGPLIDKNAVEKVKEQIKDALSKGATCLVGGKEHKLGHSFFEPTLLKDVDQNMLVAKDETFGPMCPLFKFETEEEVIQKANDTKFGLASYFFTESPSRQWRVAEAFEYGMVGINTGLISNAVAPFGGVKQSGIGREGSKYGIDEYVQMKYMCVDIS